jgi:hypothetical protein
VNAYDLSSGLYIVRLQTSHRVHQTRIFLQR